MLVVADVSRASVERLLSRYGLALAVEADDEPITGSYWGEREAGIRGTTVYVRSDTPVHSLLN